MADQQRDAIVLNAPAWLQAGYKGEPGNGGRFLYVMGLALDSLLEKHNQGQRAHMPGEGTDTAISTLADDRVLVQGPLETNAAFVLRLQHAFAAWKVAGSTRAVLTQVQAYLTDQNAAVAAQHPTYLSILVVRGSPYSGGAVSGGEWSWLTMSDAQGAVPQRVNPAPFTWDWDGQNFPFREWLILCAPPLDEVNIGTGAGSIDAADGAFVTMSGAAGMATANIGDWVHVQNAATTANNGTFQIVDVPTPGTVLLANPAGVFPDANSGSLLLSVIHYPWLRPGLAWGSPGLRWGDTDRAWGVAGPVDQIAAVRALVRTWKAEHAWYQNILVSFGSRDGAVGTEFAPYGTPGVENPGGTWLTYGHNVGGTWVPARVPFDPVTCICDGSGRYVQCEIQNEA